MSCSSRCLYVGQTYALVDKYAEALSLFQRASLYIRQLRSSAVPLSELVEATPDTPAAKHHRGVTPLLIPDTSVAALEAQLSEAEDRARKDWFLFQHAARSTSEADAAESGATATEEQGQGLGLDSAVKGLALYGQSGAKRSKKRTGPLFFDVAFNYVAGVNLDVLDRAAKGDPLGAASSSSSSSSGAAAAPGLMQIDEPELSGASVVQTVQETLEQTAKQVAQKAEQAATSFAAALPEVKQEPASKQQQPQQPPSGSRFWGLFGGGKK